jgi:hypothetical protein
MVPIGGQIRRKEIILPVGDQLVIGLTRMVPIAGQTRKKEIILPVGDQLVIGLTRMVSIAGQTRRRVIGLIMDGEILMMSVIHLGRRNHLMVGHLKETGDRILVGRTNNGRRSAHRRSHPLVQSCWKRSGRDWHM